MVSDAIRPELGASFGDPFARVLAMDRREGQRWLVSILLTLLVHGAGAARASTYTGLSSFAEIVQMAARRARTEYDVQVEPPEPPKPEPPPPEPEPAPKAAPPPAQAPPPAAPPPAAQAAKVLTADPDPDEPLDLTKDGFVQGNAEAYAGGVTTSTGTNKSAVYDPNAAGSAPAPSPAPRPAPAGPDQSRPAKPVSESWDCGFPAEADIEQINYSRVPIVVTIGADGSASKVTIVQDPGYGFGALAKRCALRMRYHPALGRDGTPVTVTQPITINFRR